MNFEFIPYNPLSKDAGKPRKTKKQPTLSGTLPLTPDIAPDIAPAPASREASTRAITNSIQDVDMYGSSDSSSDNDNDNDNDSDDEDVSKKKRVDTFQENPDECVPAGQVGVSTWRERNTTQRPIPLRTNRPKQDAESRATAKLKREANKEKAAKLTAAIDDIVDVRNTMAAEVAKEHGVTVEVILRRLMSMGSKKATRKVNLFNAKVHHLCARQKKVGRPITMKEGRQRVRRDPEFQDVDKEVEQMYRDELEGHRQLHQHGPRSTSLACAADARATVNMIAEEMTALAERTGMVGFACFTRGHLHDKTVPCEIESWGGLDFFPQMMKVDPRDLGTKFELWSVAREKGVLGEDTLRSMRTEVVKYNEVGIREKGGRKNIKINWKQYHTIMIVKHRLILRGWPLDDRPPCNPGSIMDVASIKLVRDAMRDGDCFWHRMTDAEWEREKTKVNEMVEEGKVQVIARKSTRSKWRAGEEEGEEEEVFWEKATSSRVSKRARPEPDDEEENARPRKKSSSTRKTTSSSSSRHHSSKTDDRSDKFKAMQRKLRQLSKGKSVSMKLPPTIRGGRS
ncbi:hypothetical protein B0H13DRAFT_2356992 [Mycena leptocephala]|nr:hypothetical protein B0H13DRAFT_2356992 [Mycena leptocephala]